MINLFKTNKHHSDIGRRAKSKEEQHEEMVRNRLLSEYSRDMKRKLYFGHLPEEQQRKLMP